REREPDQNESDEMSARKWLVIKENAKKERTNRRKILEEADRDEARTSGGVAEPQKRNGGDDAGADQQARQQPARAGEHERARALKIKEKNHRKRNEEDRFNKQAGNGGGTGLF